MTTIKSFLSAKAVLEVQEGRRTSVGLDAKQGVKGLEAYELKAVLGTGEEVTLIKGGFDMSYEAVEDNGLTVGNHESELAHLRKVMFVVLEGPDCSGKTTLAANLSEILDIPVEKNLRMTDHNAMVQSFADDLVFKHPRKTGEGILKDRWQYPSDIIYEEIHGRAPSKLLDWEPTLINQFVEGKVLFLYVKASQTELVRRLNFRGDDEINTTQVRSVAAIYDSFFKTRKDLPQATLDTTGLTEQEVTYAALDLIMKHYKEELK